MYLKSFYLAFRTTYGGSQAANEAYLRIRDDLIKFHDMGNSLVAMGIKDSDKKMDGLLFGEGENHEPPNKA